MTKKSLISSIHYVVDALQGNLQFQEPIVLLG